MLASRCLENIDDIDVKSMSLHLYSWNRRGREENYRRIYIDQFKQKQSQKNNINNK